MGELESEGHSMNGNDDQQKACGFRLRGFENHIGVLSGFSGANETDGPRNAKLELYMRLERARRALKRVQETFLRRLIIHGTKFLGHEHAAGFPVRKDCFQNLRHGGNAIHKGEINRFNLGPKRKATISDHERVGVADAREKRADVGI